MRAEGAGPPSEEPRDLLYRGLFENVLHEVHIWEIVRGEGGEIMTWRLVDANPATLEIWGRDLEEVVGKTTDEIFPGAGATELFLPVVSRIIETGSPEEWELQFPGTDQILHMVSIPVGEYFVSTGFDITELREQESELKDALHKLNQAIKAGRVGLWDWDLVSNEVHYSDEWKRQIGYEPHEISSRFEEWEERVHPDDLEPTLKKIRASIEVASQNHETFFRMLHKDGSYRWILARASIVTAQDGTPIQMYGSHIDVTERRRLEALVQESQKMESIGQLAGGIAHDFNNFLTAIIGNLSLAKETLPSSPEAYELLRDMESAAHRAQALTQQLLTFSKGGLPVRQAASIREFIFDSARFVTRGSRCTCEFSLDDELWNVDADAGQIGQVLNNLVINATQAMPEGGTIRIGGTNVETGPENAWGVAPGRYVKVTIADEGGGIPDSAMSRIFDPFYTTKPGGSGLGLATSYSIMSNHGGRITVESEVGRGSTFAILIPASEESVPTVGRRPVTRGEGRILIMDDDELVRTAMKRMVEWLGYECDTAHDEATTLELYREALSSDRPYRAVILDLTIPGRPGGREALARLRNVDPDVIALVSSGYSDSDLMAEYKRHGFDGRLPKPIDTAGLSLELRRALSRSRPAPSPPGD